MWTPDPDDVRTAQITEFARLAAARTGRRFDDYDALLRWSTDDLRGFWRCIWDFFDIAAEQGSETVLVDERMPGARWFPDARLNYVDQVFRDRPDDGIAIHEFDETGHAAAITWSQLRSRVAAVQRELQRHGVGVGDRVVGYLPNNATAVVAFLATASLGAIWSACGMDYAPSAALGRFGQLEPLILFAADGYTNAGKRYDRTSAVAELQGRAAQLESSDRHSSARVRRAADDYAGSVRSSAVGAVLVGNHRPA